MCVCACAACDEFPSILLRKKTSLSCKQPPYSVQPRPVRRGTMYLSCRDQPLGPSTWRSVDTGSEVMNIILGLDESLHAII